MRSKYSTPQALTAFRAGDARPIIREFAMASRIAASTGAQLVDHLVAQLDASRALLQVAARMLRSGRFSRR